MPIPLIVGAGAKIIPAIKAGGKVLLYALGFKGAVHTLDVFTPDYKTKTAGDQRHIINWTIIIIAIISIITIIIVFFRDRLQGNRKRR